MIVMGGHFFVLIAGLFFTSLLSSASAAFGDRIRPITQNPLYFRNATVRPTVFDDHLESTTEFPKDKSGSPEPADDETPGTPVDITIHGSTEETPEQGESNGIYPEYDAVEEGKAYSTVEPEEEKQLNSTPSRIQVIDIYPLDPPQSISNKDNISSSDTYDNYHYAVPPHVNPYDRNKVVFLSPLRPQPGSENTHHHARHPVVKKIVRVTDTPVYRDSGPRIRYIKKSIIGRHPIHKYPISHHHLETKTPSGRTITHPHEFHHHPNADARFYGYIPGIPGRPWKDYPLYSTIPRTGFDCKLTKYPGFYADIDAGCQVRFTKII